jgi:hypothetical protein
VISGILPPDVDAFLDSQSAAKHDFSKAFGTQLSACAQPVWRVLHRCGWGACHWRSMAHQQRNRLHHTLRPGPAVTVILS